jgi:hypothetical protein
MRPLLASLFVPALSAACIGMLPASAQNVIAHRGAHINGTLTTALSSKTNHDGDAFTLDAKDAFFYHNPLPTGSVIDGHVEHVSPAGPTHKATMVIVIDDVALPDGVKAPLKAQVVSLKEFEPKTHHLRDAAIIVGGAVAGHMMSKRTGVPAGTLAGATAGFALVSTMKSDIVVHRGTIVHLQAKDDVAATAGT